MSDKRISETDKEMLAMRLEKGAYYYGFSRTGDRGIDLILGAMSAAGKGYHCTEDWFDGCGNYESADNYIELIQMAANEAAQARAAFDAACEELAEVYESIHSTLMNTHAGSHELRTASLAALDRFKRTYDVVHGKDKHDER